MDPHRPAPFKVALKELRLKRGLSQENLAFETQRHGAGVSTAAVRVYEAGRSRPGRAVYEAIAKALGVAPEEFPEYRLAVMREALDESVVGLEAALEMLALIERRAKAAPDPSGASQPILPSEWPKSRGTPAPQKKRRAS